MSERHQALMDAAYDRWRATPGTTKEQFWATLSAAEEFAVFMGNMNYQVQNGGWEQWFDNMYGTDEVVYYILHTTKRMGTPAALMVHSILSEVMEVREAHDADDEDEYEDYRVVMNPLCDRYYDVDEAFMAECEAYLEATFK